MSTRCRHSTKPTLTNSVSVSSFAIYSVSSSSWGPLPAPPAPRRALFHQPRSFTSDFSPPFLLLLLFRAVLPFASSAALCHPMSFLFLRGLPLPRRPCTWASLMELPIIRGLPLLYQELRVQRNATGSPVPVHLLLMVVLAFSTQFVGCFFISLHSPLATIFSLR